MELKPHRQTPSIAIRSIDVAVWETDDRWHFRYLMEGADVLVLPDTAAPVRADGLWRTTCLEAFIGLNGDAYLEFNFSPSGQWAAYRFAAPREGMREEPALINIWLEGGEGWIAVEAAISADLGPGSALGLAAVIEEEGGRKSYWALAHPAGPPDFHDPSCFLARLPE